MQGPYSLSIADIDKQVTKTSAGNYASGLVNDKEKFIVKYIGRSDTDLNTRMKKHATTGEHPKFKYAYATSPKTACEKECKNFHDFGGTEKPENGVHPDRPAKSGWKCPYCKSFD